MPECVAHNRVAIAGRLWSWAELVQDARQNRNIEHLASIEGPIAFVVDDALSAYRSLAILEQYNLDGLLVGADRLSEGVRSVLDSAGYYLFHAGTGDLCHPIKAGVWAPGRITLLTSGSTGIPKLVPHGWETLFTGRKMRQSQKRCWLLPYQVGTYAWFQITTLGLFLEGQTLIPGKTEDLAELFRLGRQYQSDSISATPTFWRMALLGVAQEILRAIPFRFISLGGETVDQAVLDRLHEIYPQAHMTHVYASTEVGTSIIVKDRLAGFPAALLQRNEPELPELKIMDGRLWVRSPFTTQAAAGEPQNWIDTGDLVEQRENRVYFLGRANASIINVGGNKAYPADIESILLKHPAVTWCRVRAVKAAFVGFLPEADLYFSAEQPVPSEAELTAFCQGKLPEYAIPRFWNRLEKIPVQASLKSTL